MSVPSSADRVWDQWCREEKLGLSANKTVQFKKGLQEAWESVADKHGNPNLSCDEIRDVLSVFGYV